MGRNSGNNEAALARAEEEARQRRIREGTQRINTIFDGGTVGTGRVDASAAYDPAATYYRADGSVYTPPAQAAPRPNAPSQPSQPRDPFANPFGLYAAAPELPERDVFKDPFGLAPSGTYAPPPPPDPNADFRGALLEGLYSGTEVRSGFNDDFFKQQQQNYINYAMPQLEDQRNKANKELIFATDRAGQLEGSARADLAGELQKRYDLQTQKVRDDGLAYSTQARTSVEGARSDLIAMLNATGDADGAARSAIARSAALSEAPAYSPLTNLFADFTGALGTQAAAERAFAYGGPRPTYNTGLFAPKNNSVALT